MRGLIAVLLVTFCGAAPSLEEDFMWGTATAAFQIEGHTKEGGRTPSVWDHFANPELRHAHQIRKDHDGNPANQDYVHYSDKTVPLLQDLGAKWYRMSISWTRILQNQTIEKPEGDINQEGLDHYKKVFAALKEGGIEPVITMWHWDTPQDLEEKYGGFLDRENMPKFFGHYARVLIENFGDDCKYWITLNEPLTVVQNGYSTPASHAPGRCSDRAKCPQGNDATEPYLAGHTMILAHAQAFKEFKKLRAQGTIGITLNADFCEPSDPSSAEDKAAAERCMEGQNAWFFDPIYYGHYPESMQVGVGDRLPKFTAEEKELVHGSHMNVYFQNQYTANYAAARANASECKPGEFHVSCDLNIATSKTNAAGEVIGYKTPANEWLYKYPVGFRKYQKWIDERYRKEGSEKINIIVSENGWGDDDVSKDSNVVDLDRCNYYREYIGNMSLAVHKDDVHVRGYFAWSLMDNFEWAEGYTTRFGLTYMDYATQKRTPKLSFRWMSKHVMPLKQLPEDGVFPPCSKQEFEEDVKAIQMASSPSKAKKDLLKKGRKNGKKAKRNQDLVLDTKIDMSRARRNEY